ncbi:MAG TPA: acyl carrier protein [Anaeromyxobacter sp.]
MRVLDARTLLDAARQSLATVSDGVDASAVQPETPLAALIFDSLVAVNFIATLETALGIEDLPFERWLSEHSERAEALTVGSLVDWLGTLPEITALAVGDGRARAMAGSSRGG